MFSLSYERSFFALLLIGLALRCMALTQPLVDAHLLRQCQTAAVTRSLLELPGFPIASRIPWLGDIDARFILELPFYNYLVMGLHGLTGQLDLSGKLTTILLWAVSFVLLQRLWRRLLDREQTVWANLLFVIAPLEVFFGQAFMPEMLVQALAFGFVLLAFRYGEAPTLSRWIPCAAVGLLGLLVKFPEIVHLYAILGFLIVRNLGWKAAFWPRHVVAGVIAVASLKVWGAYVNSFNVTYMPEWSAEAYLHTFLGTLGSRFQLKPWAAAGAYLAFFVVPGIAALATAGGLWIVLRSSGHRLLCVWLLSLAAYYLVWFGNAGTAQSYYNLPAVAPLCALFALGMTAALRWEKIARWRLAVTVGAVLLLVASVAPGLQYLFKQDRRIFAAALWAREHVPPGDVLIFRPNHRWDMVDYIYNPVVAYYSGRATFVWTRLTPEPIRRVALERARYAIVTTPPPPPTGLAGRISRIRGTKAPEIESGDWLDAGGFVPLAQEEGFTVHRRD